MSSNHPKHHGPNRAVPLLGQKIKTIQSIGTFNETPVNFSQFDQSIICKRQVFVQNPFLAQGQDHVTDTGNVEDNPKASRIETDTGEIARMKMLFESRVNNQKHAASRIHNKSMDRSPNGRSMQKHILKPTHTPSFNKFEPKNISYSIIQQNPGVSLKFNNPNNQGDFAEQPQNHEKRRNELLQSSSKKSAMDCSQISSKFEEYEFGDDFNNKEAESMVSHENQHFREMSNETPKKIDFSELKVVKPATGNNNQNSQKKPYPKCSCQSTLTQFMQQTSSKLAQLTERLMFLENENVRLRQLQSKVLEQQESLKSYQQQHELVSQECNELRQSNYTYQAEKEELETLLKEILFKREKEKFQKSCQASKQNTYREEETTGPYKRTTMRKTDDNCYRSENEEGDYIEEMYDRKEKETMFKKESTMNSKKQVEPLGLRGSNIQEREMPEPKPKKDTESKMKVQNLLSKLHIKIQKS